MGVGLVDGRPGVFKRHLFHHVGLKDSMEDQNELLREQNGFLKRIAQSLDGALIPGDEEGLEEDSTIRE